MSRARKRTGKTGEDTALSYLSSKGLTLVDKNFLTPFGEIDLILKDKDELVFIEVRTRTTATFGTPLESIRKFKQDHILKNCRYYMNKYRLYDKKARIDVIGIKLNSSLSLEYLRYIKNAIEVKS